METQEISKEELKDLTLCTLVSFFDGNISNNLFAFRQFKSFLDSNSIEYSDKIEDEEAIQVYADMLNLSVNLVGTGGLTIVLDKKEDIIKFISYYCEITDTSFMLSYDDILLYYK